MTRQMHWAGFIVGLLWITAASAAELKFVTPDGQPASGIKVYRTYQSSPRSAASGMGMEMMSDYGMGEMMGMDMGMEGASGAYGGEMGYVGEGMMDGSGMESGYEMMGMSGGELQPGPASALAFLNGQPWQRYNQRLGDQLVGGDDHSVSLDDKTLFHTRSGTVHRNSLLAIHPAGISYIPAGTKLSSTSQLRSLGTLIVNPPEGIDADKFIVVTCWHSGFADPSFAAYRERLGMGEQPAKALDPQDWRFRPQFRLFQTARLGEPIAVPPGEVRVSIVPERALPDLDKTDPKNLYESVLSCGPSTIVLVPSQSKTPVQVHFAALRSLVCKIPTTTDEGLPDWGDDSQGEYYLRSFKRIAASDTDGLTSPPASALASTSAFADFLNQQRAERADFQSIRLPSSVSHSQPDGMSVRFDLLQPGWYTIVRKNVDGSETLGISILELVQNENETTALLATKKIKGVDDGIHLAVAADGQVSFRTIGPPQSPTVLSDAANQSIDSKRSDEERLKLAQSLRREIEQTITRLIAQRGKLIELEATIRQTKSPLLNQDPFGAPPSPFQNEDPFGAADPFGN